MESEPPAKKFKKNYVTWSNSERHVLVDKRIERDIWFTGKNANSSEGWKKIAAELQGNLTQEKDANSCKTQWNALIKKYKSFFKYRSGEGTGEEAMAEEAKEWDFFDKIHAYAAKKDNYHPPFLIDSCDGVLSMHSNSNVSQTCTEDESSSSAFTILESSSPSTSTSTGTLKVRNEFLRLEQHIKQRDKKINKKISSLLAVFGQMVQTDYPHIDATSLILSSDSDSN